MREKQPLAFAKVRAVRVTSSHVFQQCWVCSLEEHPTFSTFVETVDFQQAKTTSIKVLYWSFFGILKYGSKLVCFLKPILWPSDFLCFNFLETIKRHGANTKWSEWKCKFVLVNFAGCIAQPRCVAKKCDGKLFHNRQKGCNLVEAYQGRQGYWSLCKTPCDEGHVPKMFREGFQPPWFAILGLEIRFKSSALRAACATCRSS